MCPGKEDLDSWDGFDRESPRTDIRDGDKSGDSKSESSKVPRMYLLDWSLAYDSLFFFHCSAWYFTNSNILMCLIDVAPLHLDLFVPAKRLPEFQVRH
jgi:hypothetical protein